MVCVCVLIFRVVLCFFEGVPPSRDHFLGSKGAVGWPWRLGDDSVTIFDRFGLPSGASQGSLLKAFGRQ